MEAPLVRVKDDGWNDKAQQQRPDHCRQGSGRASAQSDDVDSGNPMADAVAQSADQQYLFRGEHGKRGPGISGKSEIADQERDAPVNADAEYPPACPCNRTRTGFGHAEPLARIF